MPEADVDELVARYDRCLDECDLEEASRGFERCRELYAKAGNLRGEAYVLHRLAQVATRTGRLPEAKRLYVEAIDRHRTVGLTSGVADVSFAEFCRMAGERDEARRLNLEAHGLAAQTDSFAALGDASRGRAILELTDGDLSAAWGSIVQAIRAYEAQPSVPMQIDATALRGEIELALGDAVSARRTFEGADRLAVKAGCEYGRIHALAGLGREAASRGDAPAAVGYLERALGVARGLKLPLYEATVLADLGLARRRIDPEAGEAALDEALSRLRALGLVDEVHRLQEEMAKP